MAKPKPLLRSRKLPPSDPIVLYPETVGRFVLRDDDYVFAANGYEFTPEGLIVPKKPWKEWPEPQPAPRKFGSRVDQSPMTATEIAEQRARDLASQRDLDALMKAVYAKPIMDDLEREEYERRTFIGGRTMYRVEADYIPIPIPKNPPTAWEVLKSLADDGQVLKRAAAAPAAPAKPAAPAPVVGKRKYEW